MRISLDHQRSRRCFTSKRSQLPDLRHLQATDDLVDRGGQEGTHELEDPVAHHFAPGPQRRFRQHCLRKALEKCGSTALVAPDFLYQEYTSDNLVGQNDQLHQKKTTTK